MISDLKQLLRIRLFTPAGLFRLSGSVFHSGVNLMALLGFAARQFPHNIAITDASGDCTYTALHSQSMELASLLRKHYSLSAGKKVAVLCSNHIAFVRTVFAVSRTGADLFLLNAEMSSSQYRVQAASHAFDLVIHDPALLSVITAGETASDRLAHPCIAVSIDKLTVGASSDHIRLKPCRSGKLSVLTGGTTGDFKAAARKASTTHFFYPFVDLTLRLRLASVKCVLVATPLYHGFGIASLFMAFMHGSRILLMPGFDAAEACRLVSRYRADAITVVPLMLRRILDLCPETLKTLTTIISGGDALDARLAEKVNGLSPGILFNLYGTSEAGVATVALPADLVQNPGTIGRPLKGVKMRVLNAGNKEVPQGVIGRLCISSSWGAIKDKRTWTDTGDLARTDGAGLFYLCGKTDDMIVSGGENVYPAALENALMLHPGIRQAAVIGIPDPEFGQRLLAFVVLDTAGSCSAEELRQWVAAHVARFQMPKKIVVLDELPLTSIGKTDKKQLMASLQKWIPAQSNG